MKRLATAYGLWLAAVLAAGALCFLYYRRVLALAEAGELVTNGAGPVVPARRRVPEPEAELVEPPASDAGGPGSELGPPGSEGA